MSHEKKTGLEELVQQETLSQEMAHLLGNLVHAGASVLVAGRTGAGKTTVVNALANCLPEQSRILTLEHEGVSEYQFPGERCAVSLKATPEVSLGHLVTMAAQMRPDALVVSEPRNDATDRLVQLAGDQDVQILTDLWANTIDGAVANYSNLMRYTADLPEAKTLELIADTFAIILYMDVYEDRSRRVSAIAEVPIVPTNVDGRETLTPTILWSFETSGVDEEGNIQGHFVERATPSHGLLEELELNEETALTFQQLIDLNKFTSPEE